MLHQRPVILAIPEQREESVELAQERVIHQAALNRASQPEQQSLECGPVELLILLEVGDARYTRHGRIWARILSPNTVITAG
jgi:hypothetical protein